MRHPSTLRAGRWARACAWLGALLLAACAPDVGYDPEAPFEEGALGVWTPGLTVEQAGGCSTSIVAGLSRQLIEELNCLRPNTLVDYSGPRIGNNGAVWPYLQPAARDGLRRAVDARGQAIQIASALRTLPQQFLLYRWYQQGRCGISLAARPGRSRHESGLALDVQDNASWRNTLQNAGWRWLGANDPPHFDYVAGGTVDLAGLSVQAFQRLWNRNHANDGIDEDGAYGPQTERRLLQSPTDGFPIGACAPEPEPVRDARPPDPEPTPGTPNLSVLSRWVTVEGQARDLVTAGSSAGVFDVIEGQRFDATVEVRNGGDGTAQAVIAGFALTDAFLRPVAAVIERADGDGWLPLGAAPLTATGQVALGDLPAGGGARVRWTLEAVRAAPGVYAHLRGWVVSAGAHYGDQLSWDDPVERNPTGQTLRHEGLADVFAVSAWTWPGPTAADPRGWTDCDGGPLAVAPGEGALQVPGGCALSPPWTAIDGDALGALEIELATDAPALRLAWGDESIAVRLGGSGAAESHRPTVGWLGAVGPVQVQADAPLWLYAFAAAPLVAPPAEDAGLPGPGGPDDLDAGLPRRDLGAGPSDLGPGRTRDAVPLSPEAGPDLGGGCRSAAPGDAPAWPLWILALAGVALARRRRA